MEAEIAGSRAQFRQGPATLLLDSGLAAALGFLVGGAGIPSGRPFRVPHKSLSGNPD